MSRRRKRSSASILMEFIVDGFYTLVLLAIFVIKIVIRILTFFISMIGFYKTQYKIKSGNGFLNTYFDKGNWGEYQLYKKLTKVFGEDKLLTNIYIPSKNIDNTEIDVLGVHNGIIYCYEVKNYGGHIYGNIENKNWTQVLQFRIKNKFYNPFRQNYAHTKALEEYLQIEEKDIMPIVVFSNCANLSNVETRNEVIHRLNEKFCVSEDLQGKLTDDVIIAKLTQNTNVCKEIKDEHIEQVNMLKEKEF